MVGVVFDILCQIKRTDAWPVSEHVTTMSLQTLPGGQETSTSKQASHRDRKKNASKGNSGTTSKLEVYTCHSITVAVSFFKVCLIKIHDKPLHLTINYMFLAYFLLKY